MEQEERKERVLHTRIPAALEGQIKRLAEALRVPVSNLVRNMLEDALGVPARLRRAGGGAQRSPLNDVTRRVRGEAIDNVYGWQALTLNLKTSCSRCDRELVAGDPAYVGLSSHPRDEKVFICSACLPHRSEKANQGDAHGRQG